MRWLSRRGSGEHPTTAQVRQRLSTDRAVESVVRRSSAGSEVAERSATGSPYGTHPLVLELEGETRSDRRLQPGASSGPPELAAA